jgi:hypothetical protein
VARYEALLARLRAYGSVRVDERPSPQTVEELAQQAGALYVGTAFRLDTLNFDGRRLAQRAQENAEALRKLEERAAALKLRAGSLPAELRTANEKLSKSLADAERYELLVASVERLSERMHERADRAAEESVQWLNVALPKERTPLVGAETLAGRKHAPHESLSEDEGPAPVVAGRPGLPVPLNVSRPPGPRPAPQGTADEKIAAVEALLPQLSAATEQYEAASERYRKGLAALREATPRVETLEAAVGGASQSLEAVEELNRRAQSRELHARINGYRAGANAAEAIAEAYILEHFRDHVVRPTVIRFLRRNGISHRIDRSLVAQLYTMHKSLLPSIAGQHWDELNRLIDAEKRALEVINDYKTYALAAAASAGDPNDRIGDALGAEINEGTQAAGEQIIEKAAGDQGPIYTIVRAMLGRP